MAAGLSYWAELKTSDFAAGDPERRIALLPVGAVEQHGPHLPLGTDSYIAEAIVRALPKHLDDPDARDAAPEILVLPTQTLGDSLEHRDFPGTLPQTPETLIAGWTRLGHAVAAAGLGKLAILNTHGGQPQVVDIVAQRLRADLGMLVGRINSFRLGVPDGLFPADELAYGYHGGSVETSLMLAIAPELVDMTEALGFDNAAARLAAQNRVFAAEGGAGFAWQAQDLNPAGVTGDAADADAERGAAVLDHLARRVAGALAEMAAFPLSALAEGPR